jgi:hypothetical protein
MIRECEICGEELADQESEKVCLSCRNDTIFDCSRCGATMDWRNREYSLCDECREIDPGVTVTTGRGEEMTRECEMCGVELTPHETEGVCLACQHTAHTECPRCGSIMHWREREHLLCKSCRHDEQGETITDGKY